jgi:carboxymethylenebutenolidase
VVLVIHENRGLNPYIEDVARRLALANFIAFAPDGLTSVGGYPGSDEKGAEAFRKVDGKKMTEDFVAAAKWLKTRSDSTGKLGAVGFCFGGGIVNQLAVRLGPDLNAGSHFTAGRRASTMYRRSPRRCCFSTPAADQRINEGIPAYEAALKANNKVYQIHMYEGKQHGFHNDTTPRYDEEAAKLAWTRTLDFFNKYLR